MTTQYCHAKPLTLEQQLEQCELVAKENLQRKKEQITLHLPQVDRKYEIDRHNYRVFMNQERSIDYLMKIIYPQDPHDPWNPINLENPRNLNNIQNVNFGIYLPSMVEEAVSNYPLNLELLLSDIKIFLKFEVKHYQKFWKEVHTRINLTTFVFIEKKLSTRTQNAAVQSLPKIKSYWPI